MKVCKAGLAILFVIGGLAASGNVMARHASPARMIFESRYTTAHSFIGDSFDPRDGWQAVNVTDLPYKYRRDSDSDDEWRVADMNVGTVVERRKQGITGTIAQALKSIFKGLRGKGPQKPATITWYTGHDLLNPSCWADGKWAPTDDSFAAALTLEGWTDRPKCFQFLELCNKSNKCIFVRVVDTCAGCAPGSKHIDLTKAAFEALADLDTGLLTVNFRRATQPTNWSVKLWGPKVKDD